MPRTEPTVVDSPPVELPSHKPIPLKRTQSAASICSLPTPPRTRKRKRSRSTHSRATDSDSEIDERGEGESEEEEEMLRRKAEVRGAVLLGSKKRKVLQLDMIAAELSGQAVEDAFWTSEDTTLLDKRKEGGETSSKDKTTADTRDGTESPQRSPSASPPARLLKRNRTGLLSPPQSRRRKSPRTKIFAIPQPVLEAPSTPARTTNRPVRTLPRKKAPLVPEPERDSPNNPFLDSASASSITTLESEVAVASSSADVLRAPRKPHVEKPTITYVFRGVRTEFANPLYDPRFPETGMPPPGEADPSKLDPLDPDFEPDEHCPPKLLFPTAQRKTRSRRPVTPQRAADPKPAGKKAKARERDKKSEWDTTDEEDNADGAEEDDFELPCTPSLRRSPRLAKIRVEAELKMPAKDRSDPAKRAFGPRDKASVDPKIHKRAQETAPKAKSPAPLAPAPKAKAVVSPARATKAKPAASPARASKTNPVASPARATRANPVASPARAPKIKLTAPPAPAPKTRERPAPVALARAPAPRATRAKPREDPDENPFL